MRTLCIALALATLFSLIPANAASDRVVNDLSDGALLGQIESTQALQQAFDAHADQLAIAGSEIGLTPAQYHDVRMAIAEGRARYVELPRHIDAMSGRHGDRVFTVRNIRIPRGVYGWEVDLDEAHDVVKVYVPNRCGNLSLVRAKRPQVLAAEPVYHRPGVAYAPPAVAPYAPLPASYSIPPSEANVAYQPDLSAPQPVQAATHHFRVLPWLAGALIVGFIASRGHGGGISIGSHPTVPLPVVTPTPAPVSCPSPAARRRP